MHGAGRHSLEEIADASLAAFRKATLADLLPGTLGHGWLIENRPVQTDLLAGPSRVTASVLPLPEGPTAPTLDSA